MYRIMIIEDNEKIRNELCDFLGKNGYEALGPDDFEHTLDIIHKEPVSYTHLTLPTT